MDSGSGKKRKRANEAPEKSRKPKKISQSKSANAEDKEAQVLLLEAQILESRRHYNNIVTLLSFARPGNNNTNIAVLASVSLCRVYCRLLAAGNLARGKATTDSELLVLEWLKERLNEYVELLLEYLQSNAYEAQATALTLLMRLVKEEVNQRGPIAWEKGVFARTIHVVLGNGAEGESLRQIFRSEYFAKYDDVRFFTLDRIPLEFKEAEEVEDMENLLISSIELLSNLESPPEGDEEMTSFFAEPPNKVKHTARSLAAHKKRAQQAWLSVLASPGLLKEQRKSILSKMVHRIVPWFTKVERLMDFLTDSYNVGEATSLLALSGLFYLMQEKNLDYPSFYPKLYSLLDEGLLHSKHRSRFFRLLETFMTSTHLPAALVASFIKRLARLALHAPPAGIVVVVPWVYNMFKMHPQCTFMIHREPQTAAQKQDWEDHGFKDPFNMETTDPMETGAIDSSLWEIETLQSHYHPNVATLAKIISEQFTKQSYHLEDFLDHSYTSLIGAEVGKDMKKTPIVEYQIPKHIFTGEEDTGLNPLGLLMAKILEN